MTIVPIVTEINSYILKYLNLSSKGRGSYAKSRKVSFVIIITRKMKRRLLIMQLVKFKAGTGIILIN